MFTPFFFLLRERKVPVSLTEWMTLMEALSKGFINDLDDFYYLSRSILVKSETHFDQYDVAFQEYFKGIKAPVELSEELMEWLRDPVARGLLSEEEMQQLQHMDFDELLKEFEKRLKEQTEQHDGGKYWIGRGGTSPFGHSGSNPAGIRIGGQSRGRHAIQVAEQRRYRNYRGDVALDVRQFKLALRRLRLLSRIGPEDELDLEETIDATAKNAGELEMVWTSERKNSVKLLLLMDTGGSMLPYVELCSRLFSAAYSMSHFKDLQCYYFHNCVYDTVYVDMEKLEGVSTASLLHTLEPDYRVVLVGDARMAPEELMQKYGAIYYFERNESPGVEWLKRIAGHFTHSAWLNPEDLRYWQHPTVHLIGRIFPMFPLTLDGLDDAVKKLVAKR